MTDKQFMIAGGAAIVSVGLLVWGVSRIGDKVVDSAAGVLTGNNSLTEDTPYEGMGVLGTLGSAFNEMSGGLLEGAGGNIGGWLADVLNPPIDM